MYSFSFARNPRWTQVLASADELREYLNKVAADYDLPSKMSFRHQVERCEWLESKGVWRMQVRNLTADTLVFHECQFLFSGTGILVTPRKCDVPGADTFAGPIFHSARWRHDIDLTGKNVVLVGNGCTASQIVPAIVDKTKTLTQFVRSKHWYIPPINVPHTQTWQWLFEHVPGVLIMFRTLIFLGAEETMRGMYDTADGARHRRRAEKIAISYVKKTAPKKYHDMLIPDFPMGCKRRIHDPGYCSALHADNISVTEEPLVEILPHAVRARDGTVTNADVIVLANGFETNEYMHGMEVAGRGGKTVNEHWKTFGGPEAYTCSAMSDFPNFFMILGAFRSPSPLL